MSTPSPHESMSEKDLLWLIFLELKRMALDLTALNAAIVKLAADTTRLVGEITPQTTIDGVTNAVVQLSAQIEAVSPTPPATPTA